MYNSILKKEKKISVIGLGYVGLPIALEFAKYVKVVGFDVNSERIEMMKNKIDPSNELEKEDFENTDILFSSNPEDLRDCHFHIIAVPTPIDEHKLPDLFPILSASETVGKILKKGDYVIYESTVYPGCTEDDCVPVLEKMSGLKYIEDFKVGFSPERINPGDKQHTLTNIVKITSGCDEKSAEEIAKIYEIVIKAGIHRASSIKVAEAAKIIENTQRDVNIALMNELSIIFDKIGINTFEVLEAAGTKWNFLNFTPGLVGGHCIGVDPYYLLHKAKHLGYHAKMIGSGRALNDNMGPYVADKTVKLIIANKKEITKTKVLIMGVTFKENVSDIRNSRVIDIIEELQKYNIQVDVVDAFADAKEVKQEYNVEMINEANSKYTAIIVAVNHKPYLDLDENYFSNILIEGGVLVDVKGIYRNKIKNLSYWSL
ncbi:MAG: nucleotide sugar dehydrogenase [Bacteroidales bacterium]|jgi:UDP-N-acetyl-D-galactosamine dehydrogenase|nr:nucleotide sugar dehydrogenase [Bacteroidales bacterium]MCK9498205.1 nucleotide sugar dehydrogenase [Bacteroidales bacterium]MDY0313624.1 nucleotide sugar dehydrogenase [Bacteroidales bacterium]NLB87138.1 nucleotide sugar dehydrogenase [Bacteroidales bacterium]